MRTLAVDAKVAESIIGTASLGPRFSSIQVGRMAPLIRSKEDLLGLLHAGFLEDDLPIEINLLAAAGVRGILIKSMNRLAEEGELTERRLLNSRPIVAYIPPETLASPSPKATAALEESGPLGASVAALRLETSDVEFWRKLAARDQYRSWIHELADLGAKVRTSLFAPPVPVITRDQPDSPQAQLEANGAFGRIWTRNPALRGVGTLYSLHVHPSAFRSPEVVQRTLAALNLAFSTGDVPFWGVHLSFTDIGVITQGSGQQVETASTFLREVVRLAEASGLFVWVSDVGPIGAALLDSGPAFASYHLGMTPRKIYLEGVHGGGESLFGKALGGLWNFNLLGRSEVANLKWRLEEMEDFSNVVPVSIRSDATGFRQKFAKPYNSAVMTKYNKFRERALVVDREPAPGRSVVGRSKDKAIVPWAVG
jgi:hypothetical protein